MKKLLFRTTIFLSLQTVLLSLAKGALASVIGDLHDPLPAAATAGGLGGILTRAFGIAIAIAGMLAVLIVIWGGFRYLLAQGDEKAVMSARSTITGAVIGLVIILSIGVIGFIIASVFGINVIY